MRKYPSSSRLGRECSIEGPGERAWTERGAEWGWIGATVALVRR